MPDEIGRLSDELARDPASLAFVPLADALRRAGQLDVALRVVLRGLERHAYQAEAHAAAARVYSDLGERERAKDEWEIALRLAPGHLDSLRGLGFLAYQRGDADTALRHLRDAVERSPEDRGLRAALERVSALRRDGAARPEPRVSDVPAAAAAYAVTEPLGELLVDPAGLVLAGRLSDAAGSDVAAAVGAELTGVTLEAVRALERLGLGDWRALTVDAERATLGLAPGPNASLALVAAAPGTAAGLLRRQLERARQRALQFLEATA
ncbi:MAG: hypothetical protein ACT4R6_04020 [Gemmatimonadaceae bacterium]